MNEIIFLVEDAVEGGYTARALGLSVFVEADDLGSLHKQIRDAIQCHFDPGEAPKVVRLHLSEMEGQCQSLIKSIAT